MMLYNIFCDKTAALIMGFAQNLLYHCFKLGTESVGWFMFAS